MEGGGGCTFRGFLPFNHEIKRQPIPKILDYSRLFVADAPMKIKKHLSEDFRFWLVKSPKEERVKHIYLFLLNYVILFEDKKIYFKIFVFNILENKIQVCIS